MRGVPLAGGTFASLLAHDAVIVAVVHVTVRWMATSHRCNAVPARFRTGDPTVAVVIVLLQRSRAAGSWGLTCLGTLSVSTSAAGLTHDAIAIAVSHVGIGWMVTMHRGNAVRAGFRAGDPTVAVVVPLCDLSRQLAGTPARIDALRHASATTDKGGRRAGGKHPVQGVGLLAVNGQAVLLANANDALREPALVPVRQPFGGVTGAFLSTIHPRTGQGQIQEVRGEAPARLGRGGTQPAVMRFRPRDDVLDVGLPPARKRASGIRTPDSPELSTIRASIDCG